ncbi:MAG: toll/interleukin-1 receptor domain-containing protein, partial [Pseudomonadota bacterium]
MPQTLFISYSHKDEKHKDYVIGQLGVAEQQGLLRTWDDRRIGGGGDWRGEIEAALAEAKVAVLLVSHHFLTSDFILNEEVSTILRRRDRDGVVVYPIVLRGCDWESVDWLKATNLRPKDGKPLARFTLARRDEVMAGISKEIRGLLDDGAAPAPEPVSPSPVDDEIDRLAARTEALSAELGTTRDALNGMFEVLAEQNVPVEQL